MISLFAALLLTIQMDDPETLEARALAVGDQLRCVVCENQSIADSSSLVAEDMMAVVRDQLAAGATDDEVIAYMQNSYGDYILLKPRFRGQNVVLWLAPFAVLTFVLLCVLVARREMGEDMDELTEEEKAELRDMGLDDED